MCKREHTFRPLQTLFFIAEVSSLNICLYTLLFVWAFSEHAHYQVFAPNRIIISRWFIKARFTQRSKTILQQTAVLRTFQSCFSEYLDFCWPDCSVYVDLQHAIDIPSCPASSCLSCIYLVSTGSHQLMTLCAHFPPVPPRTHSRTERLFLWTEVLHSFPMRCA